MKNIEIQELVQKYKQVVIFGYGDIGIHIYYLLKSVTNGIEINFCDNSRVKQNKQQELQVLSVEEATKKYMSALYLLTSKSHEDNMRSQLENYGIAEENICSCLTEEATEYANIQKRKKKIKPLERIQFEVDIVSHCNLNCKCCSQFSSIAEKEFVDLEVLEKDFRRMGELFEGQAERIYLIGGEPLLHPDIIKCMQIARKHFIKGDIAVFTNGILLPKCSDNFWKVCNENEIKIIVTKYPINVDYDKIINKAIEYDVNFEFFGTSEDFKYMTNLGLDITGKQNCRSSFERCVEANNCIKLKNGRLYTCTRPAAIYKFNKFFNKELEESEKDSIDIYKAVSGQEILNFLAHPIPFCRYCNLDAAKRAMVWGATKGSMEEWL